MSKIPEKASRILHGVLLAFTLIALRVWYLATIKHEEHLTLARRPQIKTVIEEPLRGTIRDRFNVPLAVNKIEYTASVLYDPIRHIPRFIRVGKERIAKRKEYVEELASFLAQELSLDRQHVLDLLYSKAALFPMTPLILQENLPESTYYRLHAREKDWPGLVMQMRSKRHYPKHLVASTVLGFLGGINEREQSALEAELELLEHYFKDKENQLPALLPKGFTSTGDAKRRLITLQERLRGRYTKIGKAGIEARFDDQLRGVAGKKKYEINSKGNILRTLPESQPMVPGRRILLSISAELQEYAEELLAKSEMIRHQRFSGAGKNHHLVHTPWIKGGAIVAMIPKTGEIVALASYPRFDPNDFVAMNNKESVSKWLETPYYIGQIWDGLRPLEREFGHQETKLPPTEMLTLTTYLDTVLSPKSSVRKAIDQIKTIRNAVIVQNQAETLWKLSEEKEIHAVIDALFPPEKGHTLTFHKTPKETRSLLAFKLPHPSELIHALHAIPFNDDKILLLDLLRLIVPGHLFTDTVLEYLGDLSLYTYRALNQSAMTLRHAQRAHLKEQFHNTAFQEWRATHFETYLASMRREEKLANRYQKPYLDYLNEMEETLFEPYFIEHRASYDTLPPLLQKHLAEIPREIVVAFLQTMRSFNELTRPLWGRYYLGSGKNNTEASLARHFYPNPGFDYARSWAFQETAPQGSIFKVVTGYEALKQHAFQEIETHGSIHNTNPLTIIDQSPSYDAHLSAHSILGYTATGSPITRMYKGGRLPRGHPNIGKIDLPAAFERSSNLYFSLLASEVIEDPLDLVRTAKALGFGQRTGIDLPAEVKGQVPSDIVADQTALYSLAFGQHSLTVTPLQTANLFATLVNGGMRLKPQIVKTIANVEPAVANDDPFAHSDTPYQEILSRVGIYFPLFSEAEKKEHVPYVWQMEPTVLEELFLPPDLRDILFKGLHNVLNSSHGTARRSSIRTIVENPPMRAVYEELRPYLAGKTSTAEFLYRPHLEREIDPVICKHIWFACASFKEPGTFDDSDLVVVVFLRYGDHGKEASPLATQLIKKWRTLNQY